MGIDDGSVANKAGHVIVGAGTLVFLLGFHQSSPNEFQLIAGAGVSGAHVYQPDIPRGAAVKVLASLGLAGLENRATPDVGRLEHARHNAGDPGPGRWRDTDLTRQDEQRREAMRTNERPIRSSEAKSTRLGRWSRCAG